MDNKQVKNVYCDFTKTTDSELQKMIGTVDVKSTAIYFHAKMTNVYSAALTTIQFNPIKLNVGTALNPATGIFVAPTPGKYYFAFSGISDSGVKARVLLQMMKTGTADWILVGEGYGDTTFKTFSMHATLELVKGDQVRLYLSEGRIHDNVLHNYFNYVGWLVEENELTV
ncbi:complement C1q-like protein 3 [Daphnia pulex]|uniref:complement C1q-like protein 3 n=1 Tax=Daphnia pulex TaxID=6669 RepID=UPI001EDDC8B0|nr:complement C1q-like protein 3 [Daphnia pulex]